VSTFSSWYIVRIESSSPASASETLNGVQSPFKKDIGLVKQISFFEVLKVCQKISNEFSGIFFHKGKKIYDV
jgi:hypothetical protein